MTRHRAAVSYSHRIERIGVDYRISWVVDRYYEGSRLRFPHTYSRYTDLAGATRFAKRHGLTWEAPK